MRITAPDHLFWRETSEDEGIGESNEPRHDRIKERKTT